MSQDYLTYEAATDTRYELVAGELVEMPPESDINNAIAIFLMFALGQFCPPRLLRRGTEVVTRGGFETSRVSH